MTAPPPTALIVSVPESFYDDEDIEPLCRNACRHVCQRLEERLIAAGFQIPDLMRGGCDEDWGIYLTCLDGPKRYVFTIGFFPNAEASPQNLIAVQFNLKASRWFGLASQLLPVPHDDRLYAVIKDLASAFSHSRMIDEYEIRTAYGQKTR